MQQFRLILLALILLTPPVLAEVHAVYDSRTGRPLVEPEKEQEPKRPEVVEKQYQEFLLLVAKINLMDDVEFHRLAFNYAFRDEQGLKLGYEEAKMFADELTKKFDPDRARELALHQSAFKYFMYDEDGIQSDDKEAARKFAENASKQDLIYVISHRYAFNYYFRDANGIEKKDRSEALRFANYLSPRKDAFKLVDENRKAFNYAFRDEDGMKMKDREKARLWANDITDLDDIIK